MPASNSTPPPEAPPKRPLGLFEAFGLEVEYMLVDGETLDVAPAADELLEAAAGELTDEFENGEIAWNNELALHVIELKCNGPRPTLDGLGAAFAANVASRTTSSAARACGSCRRRCIRGWTRTTSKLWPHGTRTIYETFDRIFSCKGHGWANLQSLQINLPFAGDEEFARLHAAIRFLLPILPGLAASSPIVDGERNGILDNRLVAYRGNCARIPSITGEVVPEPVGSIGEYHERVLEPIYRDLAPHDPEGVLRNEWVNARGAIARFDRMAIEIRVLDVQETPAMDVAYAELIVEVLKALCAEQWIDRARMNRWRTERARHVARRSRRGKARAPASASRQYLAAFGLRSSGTELKGLWEHLIETISARGSLAPETGRLLEHYLRHGTLATRIGKAVGLLPTRAKLARVYEELCEALADSTPFAPPPPLAR